MSSKTKKRKLTEVEKLKDLANAAANEATTAKKTWTTESKRKVLPAKEIETLEEKYKRAKEAAETALKVATEAAIRKRKANEEAELAAFLERIEENAERNEENAEKPTKRINTTVYKTEAQKAFEESFERKEAAKAAEAATRKAKRNAERNAKRIANETRRHRINNIKSKLNIKRKDVDGFIQNINALELGLDTTEIAHIITLAVKARMNVDDVITLIGSNQTYDTDDNAISFLKFARTRELDLEAFLKELKKTKIPFDEIVRLLEDIPKKEDLSEAELAYVLGLAHKASVPIKIAIDLYHEESLKTPLTKSERIRLMRVAYLSGISIDKLLHPTNNLENQLNIKNAENELNQMKRNGKIFAEFAHAKREKNLRNLEEARTREKSTTVNRTRLINTLKNHNRTKKVERPTYKSVLARRIEEAADTYESIVVKRLPITDIRINPAKKEKELAPILSKIKGALASNKIFPGKTSPGPQDVRIRVPLQGVTENGISYEVPKGYAIVRFIFRKAGSDSQCDREKNHMYAKGVMEYMDSTTTLPTYGLPKAGHEIHVIQRKDVEPGIGNEYYIESESCAVKSKKEEKND